MNAHRRGTSTRSTRVRFGLVLSLVLAAVPATAQGEYGRISGFVRDASGAALVGATITTVHSNTRILQSTLTTGDGFYTISPLAPGTYDVIIEYPGFRRFIHERLVVDAGSSLTADVSLQLGALLDAIT